MPVRMMGIRKMRLLMPDGLVLVMPVMDMWVVVQEILVPMLVLMLLTLTRKRSVIQIKAVVVSRQEGGYHLR